MSSKYVQISKSIYIDQEEWKEFPLEELARHSRGNIGASRALLASSDAIARESPVRARTLSTQQVDVGTARRHRSLDVLDRQIGDRDTSSGLASRAAVLVVLLNDNTVLGNVLQSDVRVRDISDLAGSAVDSLDANAVVGVGDGGGGDGNALDDVVGAATNRANRQAMATRASALGEGDVLTRVNSETIVLVLDVGARNHHIRRRTNIESIGVVTQLGASRVVHGDIDDLQVCGGVDAHELHGGVLDVEVLDGGLLERVCVKHLGLGLAAVAALAVPPLGAIAVNDVTRSAGDSDVGTGHGNERAFPLLVAERGGAGESDLRGVRMRIKTT